MIWQTTCADYLLLALLTCALSGIALGAVSMWAWMRWRYREGIANQRYFSGGLFK